MSHHHTAVSVRQVFNSVAVGLALLSAGAAFAQQPKVQNGISEPVKQWSKAVETGDAKAIGRMNVPSTIAYVPNAMVAQGDAITAGYAGMFDKYNAKVEIKDAHYLQSGALMNSWGLYVLTLTPKAGGDTIRMEGRFSDLAVKNKGQWQYIVDHASLPIK